jgi:hypothetical protein
MPVKLVSITNFVCKCCLAYNFPSINVSEYFNGLLIFLAVLHTLLFIFTFFIHYHTDYAILSQFLCYTQSCTPDIVHISFNTGSSHLFSFMDVCSMCFSTCLPCYPWALSLRESWDQSIQI